MRRVAALDLATSTGWARRLPGGVDYGSLALCGPGQDDGTALARLYDLVDGWIRDDGIDLIYFEEAFVGGPKSQASARRLFKLAGVIDLLGVQRRVQVRQVRADDWRMAFIQRCRGGRRGRDGRSELKRAAMTRCRQIGWAPANDDEAEALGLLYFGLQHCGELPRDLGELSVPVVA